MINNKGLLIIFLLTASCFGVLALSGPNFHVHADVLSDGAVIWVPSNYTTITEALAQSSDGDTIIVESGTYNESFIQVNNTVHIVGVNRESTVIDGNGTINFIFKVNADNVVIENLTLQNTTLASEWASAVYLFNVTNATIKNMIVANVSVGVLLTRSNFSRVMFSKFFKGNFGVRIKESSCNSTIVGNAFENLTAIVISDAASQYSKIYHNNFVNSTLPPFVAASYFDDGYPSGGNYWSDHTASDLYTGLGQNEIGSDGILDVGYPSYSPWDEYPLAHPFAKIDVVAGGGSFEVHISTNATLDSHDFNVTAKMLTLVLMGDEGSNGSCRVSIPKELLRCESSSDWVVSHNGESIPKLVLDDGKFTYLYFAYVHSTPSTVEIKGTWVIPEFLPSLLLLLVLSATIAVVGIKIKFMRESEL